MLCSFHGHTLPQSQKVLSPWVTFYLQLSVLSFSCQGWMSRQATLKNGTRQNLLTRQVAQRVLRDSAPRMANLPGGALQSFHIKSEPFISIISSRVSKWMLWSFLINNYDRQINKGRGAKSVNGDPEASSTSFHIASKSTVFPFIMAYEHF